MCLSPSVHQRGARSFTGFGLRCNPKFSGGDIEEVPPDPIPNSEVKLFGADGTATVTLWESRSLPDFFDTIKASRLTLRGFFHSIALNFGQSFLCARDSAFGVRVVCQSRFLF